MKRYIILLRGINISGKNKISMSNLKSLLSDNGYINAVSHLNSGNIAISCNKIAENVLSDNISLLIKKHFQLDIPVFAILQSDLANILNSSPNWWDAGSSQIYDNLIFVLHPATATDIAQKIGEPSSKLEQISIYNNSIFWSFDRINYSKSNWWKKTATAGIGEYLTIRTAKTVKKLVNL